MNGSEVLLAGTFLGETAFGAFDLSTPGAFDSAGFIARLDAADGAATDVTGFFSDSFGASRVTLTRFDGADGVFAIAGDFEGTFTLDAPRGGEGLGFVALLDEQLVPTASATFGSADGYSNFAFALRRVGDGAVVLGGADGTVVYQDGATVDVAPGELALTTLTLSADGTQVSSVIGIDDPFGGLSMRDGAGAITASGDAYFLYYLTDGAPFSIAFDPANERGIALHHVDATQGHLGGRAYVYGGDRIFFRSITTDSDGGPVLALTGTFTDLDVGDGPFDLGDFDADDGVLIHLDAALEHRWHRTFRDFDPSAVVARADDALFLGALYGTFTDAPLDLGLGALESFLPAAHNLVAALLAPLP